MTLHENYNSSIQLLLNDSSKTDTWKKEMLDYYLERAYNNNVLGKTSQHIRDNVAISNGVIPKDILKKHLNPLGIQDEDINLSPFENDKSYSIINNVLNTLIGEELKRAHDVRAIVINPDAVEQKERELKEIVTQKVFELINKISEGKTNDNELEQELVALQEWAKMSYQDQRERLVNQILEYLKETLKLKFTFKEGFKDKLTNNYVCYYVTNKGKEPYVRKVNVANCYIVGLQEDRMIQNADAVVEEMWLTPNQILEYYGDELTTTELKRIFDNTQSAIGTDENAKYRLTPIKYEATMFVREDFENQAEDNTIRVFNITAKVPRKIQRLKYYDEQGNELYKFVSEEYKPNKALGEETEVYYVPEVWKGTKIDIDSGIYVDIEPNEIQMRDWSNPIIVKLPYIGIVGEFSLVDDLAAFAIDYVIYAKKLKKAWIKNLGKVARIDMSRIPVGEDWNIERWYKWVDKFGIAFENPFQQDEKGNVAGNMQQTSGYYDLGMGQEIQQCINQLEYLEQMIERRSGVSRQRQGDISSADQLGTTQYAIAQSATQTESEFFEHDLIKKQVYEYLVEMVKLLWTDTYEKRQYVLDDLTTKILEIDGAYITEAEYAIVITDSSKSITVSRAIEQYALAALQNGSLSLSSVIQMMNTNSLSSKQMILKIEEQRKMQQQQQMIQQEQQSQQAIQQNAQQFELQKIEMQQQFELEQLKLKLQLESMKLEAQINNNTMGWMNQDQNRNGVDDQVELDKQKMINDMETKKLKQEKELKESELKLKEKLEIAKMESQERIARMKPKTTSK